MESKFEARYVDVKWQTKDTIASFEHAIVTIPFEIDKDGSVFIETETFRNYMPRIGFRIFSDQLIHNPYFLIDNNITEELMPIKDMATGFTWWIQSGNWNKKEKRYETELFRSVGKAYLKIQNQSICLINNHKNFDINDLEYILEDFKGSIWHIILNTNSVTKGDISKKKSTAFNQQSIDLLKDFTDAVERICHNPAMQLIEFQKKQNSRINRPVPRTFMEVANKGITKQLTSRTVEESFDTVENRYIHYCLNKLLKLYSHANAAAANFKDTLSIKLKHEEFIFDELKNKKTKVVNADVFNNEIKKLEDDLHNLQLNINACFNSVSEDISQSRTHTIRLTKQYGNSPCQFFCQVLDGINFQEKNGTYLVVVLPKNPEEIPLHNLHSKIELKITGVVESSNPFNSRNIKYSQLKISKLYSVSIVSHPLITEIKQRYQHREILQKSNWVVKLNYKELSEIEGEKFYLKTKINKIQKAFESSCDFLSKAEPTINRLKKLKTFFVIYKIQKNSTFPNNMTFIKNPHYYAARSAFNKISTIDGFDDSIFELLNSVDQIGLINISIIYERWCLLQIIRILVETYHFEIQDNWQKHLIESVLSNNYNIEFILKAQHTDRIITLTYEKKLLSGKRPDFVIDLSTTNNKDQSKPKPKRLVVDAKFKDYLKGDKLNNIIQELYETKNYSENETNQVFILHPTSDAINNISSPLEWGKSCDYGQLSNHQYGGIFLSPTKNSKESLLNLQRLLGMFLQQSIQTIINDDGYLVWHNAFCMSCGNDNPKSLYVSPQSTKGGNAALLIKCHLCKLTSKKTVCFSCQTDLYKNGYKWTYHKTLAMQLTNVVCPRCQAMF